MVTEKFNYQSLSGEDVQNEERNTTYILKEYENNEITDLEDFFKENPEIFLLDNVLMSIQFFQNYERDVEKLRDIWYKDIKFEKHEKRCFFADSIFRLIDTCVNFQPRHGPQKNQTFSLHPQRIFISNDNIEAAYDPSSLSKEEKIAKPFYQLTVKPCENDSKESCGYVSFTEFKTFEEKPSAPQPKLSSGDFSASRKSFNNLVENQTLYRDSIYLKNPCLDLKNQRRLTKTEKILSEQNQNFPSKRKSCLKFYGATAEDQVLENGFYIYEPPDKRLTPKYIHDYRMNHITTTMNKIPRKCFQKIELKRTKVNLERDRREGDCFVTKNFLNSAAFKGYLCDLLLRQLGQDLNLDFDAIERGKVHGEFILINQEGVQKCVTSIVNIKQWDKYIDICKKLKAKRRQKIQWPTLQMKKIIQILPCYAVPLGFVKRHKENLEYEREWRLEFPKAEEFLLLHLMHSHVKCYVFILLIYKSYFESEINSACFGPKHLLHLLFWLVHKNFLAWPDDKPGQNLIKFLHVLYKKLQSKTLYDFFLSNRNLFALSQLKDLHKAQTIVKRILENPLPYILRAVRNLNFKEGFYPALDTSKLYQNLKAVKIQKTKNKKIAKQTEKKLQDENQTKPEVVKKTVRFEIDEEQEWKKKLIKQINEEKKTEERERSLSQESIQIEEISTLKTLTYEKCREIIDIFILHFIEMGLKCIEFESLDQALMYLYQINVLTELLPKHETTTPKFKTVREKIYNLKVKCDKLNRQQSYFYVDQIKNHEVNELTSDEKEKELKSLEYIRIVEKTQDDSFSSESDSDSEMQTKL